MDDPTSTAKPSSLPKQPQRPTYAELQQAYKALNQESVKLHAAARRVFDAAGQGEDELVDALAALGLVLAG